MKVSADAHPVDDIVRLVARTQDDDVGVYPGDRLGVMCLECKNADEDLAELIHEGGCSHAGRHGRDHYDLDDERATPGIDCSASSRVRADGAGRTPEFRPEHPMGHIVAGFTEPVRDVHNGETIGWLCLECYNLDEDILEIIHDEACTLAGRHLHPQLHD